MVVRFSDLIEHIRNKLIKYIEIIYNENSSTEYDYYINNFFNNIKNKNYYFYTQLLGLLISDHYKMLYDKKNLVDLDFLDMELLNFYEELETNEDIVYYIEQNPEVLSEIIDNMIDYHNQDYFTKREILISCKDKTEKILNFSILNIFDYLYYCQKYTPEILKQIFDNALNDGIDKDIILLDLQCTLEELFQSDINNYYKLVSELLIGYYMIGKHNINSKLKKGKSTNLIKTINFLEHSDIINIIKRISYCDYQKSDIFLKEILEKYIEFDSNINIIECSDEFYKSTVKKLKSINKLI